MIAQVGCCDVISLQTYSIFVKTHLTDEKSKIFFENAAVAVFSFFHPFYKGIFVYQELKSYERTSDRPCEPEGRCNQNDQLCQSGGWSGAGGEKVLAVDCDPQASLTISLGNPQPDRLPVTLSDMMGKVLNDQPITPGEGILHHPEGIDLMPADIQLSGMEVSLVNAMSRETILRQYLDTVKNQYTHILLDCQPSLGMLTVNALAAANRVIIPVQAEYLPAKGLEQLLQTIAKVRRQINPKLQIDGILLAMVDNRTNFAKDIAALLRDTYGSKIKVFSSEIPHSVRAKETSAEGKSIFTHDPGGKVAAAYKSLTQEVMKIEKQREKSRAGIGR